MRQALFKLRFLSCEWIIWNKLRRDKLHRILIDFMLVNRSRIFEEYCNSDFLRILYQKIFLPEIQQRKKKAACKREALYHYRVICGNIHDIHDSLVLCSKVRRDILQIIPEGYWINNINFGILQDNCYERQHFFYERII